MLKEEARSMLDYIYTSIFKAYKAEFLDSKKVFNLLISILCYMHHTSSLLLASYMS